MPSPKPSDSGQYNFNFYEQENKRCIHVHIKLQLFSIFGGGDIASLLMDAFFLKSLFSQKKAIFIYKSKDYFELFLKNTFRKIFKLSLNLDQSQVFISNRLGARAFQRDALFC